MSNAADFHPEDVQLIAALLAGQVRVIQQADGSLGLVEGSGSYRDRLDGAEALMRFQYHPAAQGDDPAKWQDIAAQAAQRIDQMFEQRIAEDPSFRHETFLKYEEMYRQGVPGAQEELVRHVAEYGAPTPVQRQIVSLPPEEREGAALKLHEAAAAKGLTYEQYLTAFNERAQKAASAELHPTQAAEQQAQEALTALGWSRAKGQTAQQTLAGTLRAQAEGQLFGRREMPFDPKLSQQQKNEEFLKAVPPALINQFLRAGIDPRAYLNQTLDGARTAAIHDGLQGRLALRDVKLPPLPKPVFNESTDRRSDLYRAFAAHGVDDPREVAGLGGRRHTVHNGMDLDVRASVAQVEQERSGQPFDEAVADFGRSHFIPQSVRDEYRDIDPGDADASEDNPRADITRAYEQHGG